MKSGGTGAAAISRITGTSRARLRFHSTAAGKERDWVIASRLGRQAWVAFTITGLPAATAS